MISVLHVILIVGVICLVGAGFIFYGIRIRRRAAATWSWPSATGKILKSRVLTQQQDIPGENNRFRTVYEAAVEYEFSAQGQTYKNNRIRSSGSSIHPYHASAQNEVERYLAGNAVIVYYDPENPAFSVLERGTRNTLFPIFFGGFMLLFSLCCFGPLGVMFGLIPDPDDLEKAIEANRTTTKYVNRRENLGASLAEHFVPFSFEYPKTWQADPKQGQNGADDFIRVERRLNPDDDTSMAESFSVGPVSLLADPDKSMSQAMDRLEPRMAERFSHFHKDAPGPLTPFGPFAGYGLDFTSELGTPPDSLSRWGRIVLLPSSTTGQKDGLLVVMVASAKASEFKSKDDLGTKGDLPGIIKSFTIDLEAKPNP